MSRLIERKFNPSAPVYARRFFVASGRHWQPGDEFPWQRLAVDQRRVRLLFEAGKLTHLDDMPAPAARPVTPAPTVAQETQDDDIHHLAATASAEQPAATVKDDGLDDLKMQELRAIAEAEGAETKVRRTEQIEAIRAARAQRAAD